MDDRMQPEGAGPFSGDLLTVDVVALLEMSPNMLRQMGQRFDFPTSRNAPDGRRRFALDEVMALRRALRSEHSVAAAVLRARTEASMPRVRHAAS